MKRIYVVGTADTKGQELQYVKALIAATGQVGIHRHQSAGRLRSISAADAAQSSGNIPIT